MRQRLQNSIKLQQPWSSLIDGADNEPFQELYLWPLRTCNRSSFTAAGAIIHVCVCKIKFHEYWSMTVVRTDAVFIRDICFLAISLLLSSTFDLRKVAQAPAQHGSAFVCSVYGFLPRGMLSNSSGLFISHSNTN